MVSTKFLPARLNLDRTPPAVTINLNPGSETKSPDYCLISYHRRVGF
jgi:hypothetical protein